MSVNRLLLPLLVVGALLPFPAAFAEEGFWSQFRDPDDGRFDASSFLAENAFGFLPVPIIITDPAVDGGLGVIGLFFHETEEDRQKRQEALRSAENASQFLITPSVSAVAGAYTGNGSWFVGGGHMGFFKQGKIRYMGGGGYGDIDLDFFGYGDVTFPRPITLNTEAGAIVQTLKFKVGDTPFFIGPTQRFISATISPARLGSLDGDFLPPEIGDEIRDRIRDLLTSEVQTSGLGLALEFDSRDNFFSPHQGYRYTLEHLWYRDAFGSDFDYELTKFSGLNYWKLSEKFRAGLRVGAEFANTDDFLPPFATPSIQLRGIQAARYQGNYTAVVEGELTWQIDPRWSVLAFAGSGWAAQESGDLSDSPSRVTKGACFRYLIARRYGFDMGLDIARGPEDTIFYIQAGTAWD